MILTPPEEVVVEVVAWIGEEQCLHLLLCWYHMAHEGLLQVVLYLEILSEPYQGRSYKAGGPRRLDQSQFDLLLAKAAPDRKVVDSAPEWIDLVPVPEWIDLAPVMVQATGQVLGRSLCYHLAATYSAPDRKVVDLAPVMVQATGQVLGRSLCYHLAATYSAPDRLPADQRSAIGSARLQTSLAA